MVSLKSILILSVISLDCCAQKTGKPVNRPWRYAKDPGL